MGRRAGLAGLALAVLLAFPMLGVGAAHGGQRVSPAANAQNGELCTDLATVSWHTNIEAITVEGATVEVLGCGDGEPIGLQLITDHGDVPDDGPIMKDVTDEQAFFDLTAFEQRIEPVTGVRVYLQLVDEVVYWEITVDRRFFNLPGHEQRGLRQATVLLVPHDGAYRAPGPPGGYREIACEDVGVEIADIDEALDDREGSGVFTATASGRHLVCYQQTPGVPREPIDDEPEVIADETETVADVAEPVDETDEDDDAALDPVETDPDADDVVETPRPDERLTARPPANGADPLAATGATVWPSVVASGLLLGAGAAAIRLSQRR